MPSPCLAVRALVLTAFLAAPVCTAVACTAVASTAPTFQAAADTATAVRWTLTAVALWDAADADRRRGGSGDLPAPLALVPALALAQLDAAPEPAAVAAASAVVLAHHFPDRADALAARLATDVSASDSAAVARGRAAARRRLAAMPDLASAAPVALRVGSGRWAPAEGTSAVGAELPGVPTLVLGSSGALRPEPPPALGSAAFEAALDSVRWAVRDRTPAQRRAARRWANRSAFLIWAEVAARHLAARRATDAEAARALAVLGAAFHDATVACFEAKYHYAVPRPSHLDPEITLPFLVALPNFPAYPAGHGCSAGVAETVIAWAVPDAAEAVRAEAAEMAESRLWAGVHYPFDNRVGVDLGRAVARRVIAAADGLRAR